MGKTVDLILLVLVALYLIYMIKWYADIIIQEEVKRQLSFLNIKVKEPSDKKDTKTQSTNPPKAGKNKTK